MGHKTRSKTFNKEASMLNYTKGKWTYRSTEGNIYIHGPVRPSGWSVCIATMQAGWANPTNNDGYHYTPDEAEANARIMVAAGPMFEALEVILPFVEDLEDAGPYGESWQSDELRAAVELIKKSIDRAKGG
jgi:hypothetical protein